MTNLWIAPISYSTNRAKTSFISWYGEYNVTRKKSIKFNNTNTSQRTESGGGGSETKFSDVDV